MNKETKKEFFPDGTPIDEWFYQTDIPKREELGKQYIITDYGIVDDGEVQTEKLQGLIDLAATEGGGVIVVPSGTYLTGALYFKQGVNLYIEKDGVIKGSDDISDYPVTQTRIEGESCLYFPALINAIGVSGFKMLGEGTVDGNGERAWKAFWIRRKWNPNCTNKDEQRPRLVYLERCDNALIGGLSLKNSHFWTNHIYKCKRVKFIGCNIFSPKEPVPAPSADAIDIDACQDVLIKDCYMEVNDDSVVLKGGKGPWADTDESNGANERILVEDCTYGFCHSGLTCGSESVRNNNILVRRITVKDIMQLIHFKLRPDTPQCYENIVIEDVKGTVIGSFINVSPWTQFFDLKGRTDKPVSVARRITVRDCEVECGYFFNVQRDDKNYRLSDFEFKNLKIKTNGKGSEYSVVDNMTVDGVFVEEIK